jgi:hypothetical protein
VRKKPFDTRAAIREEKRVWFEPIIENRAFSDVEKKET